MCPSKLKENTNRIKIIKVQVAEGNALGERMYFQDGSGLKASVTMSTAVSTKHSRQHSSLFMTFTVKLL